MVSHKFCIPKLYKALHEVILLLLGAELLRVAKPLFCVISSWLLCTTPACLYHLQKSPGDSKKKKKRHWNIFQEYFAFSSFSESKFLSYVFQKLLPVASFHSVYFTVFIELLSLLILKVLRLFHGQTNHAEVKGS